jgi:hypothetical protein
MAVRCWRGVLAVLLIGAAVFLRPPTASAQAGDDPFAGAAVVNSTRGTAQPAALFDGSNVDPGSVAFFANVGRGSNAEVVFETPRITLSGVRLYAANDGRGMSFRRSMNRFQFFADVNGDGAFTVFERVADQSVALDYNSGQAGDLDKTPNEIEFAFAFARTTASRWRVVVTQGTSVGEFAGVRIQEVDAIPAALATTVTADPPDHGAFTLRARLSETATGAPVPGETVTMSTPAGTVCEAVTDPGGVATCSGLAAQRQVVAENGYTASFAGSSRLLPASARATLGGGGSGSSAANAVPVLTTTSVPSRTSSPTASERTGGLALTGGAWMVAFGLLLLAAAAAVAFGGIALQRRA